MITVTHQKPLFRKPRPPIPVIPMMWVYHEQEARDGQLVKQEYGEKLLKEDEAWKRTPNDFSNSTFVPVKTPRETIVSESKEIDPPLIEGEPKRGPGRPKIFKD